MYIFKALKNCIICILLMFLLWAYPVWNMYGGTGFAIGSVSGWAL